MKALLFLLLASSAMAVPFAFWKTIASGPDVTPPTLTSAGVNGSTLTLNWSEPTSGTSTYLAALDVDMSVSGSNIAVSSITSGNGTSTWVMALATPADSTDTVDLDFSGTANLIEDASGNDLAAITSAAVTNSTAGITYLLNEGFEGDTSAWTATTGGGTANLAYTPAITGSLSATVARGTSSAILARNLASTYNDLQGSFRLKVNTWPASTLTNRALFTAESTGGSLLAGVQISGTSGGAFSLSAKVVGTVGTATSATFTTASTIYVWWQWNNTTDVTTVWWNTTNSKPVGDATKTSTATATVTPAAGKVTVISDATTTSYTVDDIKVWQ